MTAFFVPPGFVLAQRDAVVHVHDAWTGAQVALEGDAAQAVLSHRPGGSSPGLRSLARLEPTGVLAALQVALEEHAPAPLTRAALLRGTGFGQLFVELTARCNERCVHCYAESSPERGEALAWPVIEAALADAAELGFMRVQLTGGDPLVSDLCVPAAERASSLGLAVEVYTNGLALVGSVYERLRELGVSLAFSFYSHDSTTHDAITRAPGSQRRTLAAIRKAVGDGLAVRASVIVMEQNRDDLEPTVALLREAGVAEGALGADVQRSVGRGLMTLRAKDAALDQILPGAAAGHRAQGAPAAAQGTQAVSAPDAAGRAAVAYDGAVYPCIFSRTLLLGRLPEQRLRDVLTDARPLEVDVERLASEYSSRQAQLACWDCRLRATVLGDAQNTQELSAVIASHHGARR